jgi:hypothetical protein
MVQKKHLILMNQVLFYCVKPQQTLKGYFLWTPTNFIGPKTQAVIIRVCYFAFDLLDACF